MPWLFHVLSRHEAWEKLCVKCSEKFRVAFPLFVTNYGQVSNCQCQKRYHYSIFLLIKVFFSWIQCLMPAILVPLRQRQKDWQEFRARPCLHFFSWYYGQPSQQKQRRKGLADSSRVHSCCWWENPGSSRHWKQPVSQIPNQEAESNDSCCLAPFSTEPIKDL